MDFFGLIKKVIYLSPELPLGNPHLPPYEYSEVNLLQFKGFTTFSSVSLAMLRI